jgi:hypothetical protein
MTTDPVSQRRLIAHGAIIILAGLACGLPSVVEAARPSGRMWQAAHSALLILGVWLLATAAVLPILVLPVREARGLMAALLLTGYSFAAAVIIQAVTGVRAISPDVPGVSKIAFVANLLAVLGAFLTASLTLIGALNALRDANDGRMAASASHSDLHN